MESVLRENIVEVLKTIEDPEVFLDIYFLGLIYQIEIGEPDAAGVNNIKIEMTFTSPMCPAGPELVQQVKDKVGGLPRVGTVEVNVVFSPPWAPSEAVQAMLGMI